MFGASYEEAEVWAVMTDSSNGISAKTIEKGPHAERYLALTIGKAQCIARVRRFAREEPGRRSRTVGADTSGCGIAPRRPATPDGG
jgi:hypothetical protein